MARSEAEELGHFFVRVVAEELVEATANEAWRLGYRSVDWEPVREAGELTPAAWMVYGRRPSPDACPFCDAVVDEEGEEGEDEDEGEDEA